MKLLVLAAAAAMALAPIAASAQPHHDRSGRDHRSERDYHRHGDGRRDHPDYRAYERRDGGYRYNDYSYQYRGPSRYYRGAYLPPAYRGERYVIYDYGRYGYNAPPRGYRYYRTPTGEIVMVAIASGIIGAIIADAID